MKYQAFPYFVFRVPTISFDRLSDSFLNKGKLQELFDNEVVSEGIYLASPVLFDELMKLSQKKSISVKDYDRLILSFARYVSRMSTRCTPFGLFAGCATGMICDRTNIVLKDEFARKTRLDMYYLNSLFELLVHQTDIKKKLKFYPNTSLYPIRSTYRYIEYNSIGLYRKYQITGVDKSYYLNKILTMAIRGINLDALVRFLEREEISEDDAVAFVEELVDSQILIPELSQTVTGMDFLCRLIELVKKVGGDNQLLHRLKNINYTLEKLDKQENNLILYDDIISEVKRIGADFDRKYLFQIDKIEQTSIANLSTQVISELQSVMLFLNRITEAGQSEQLEQFQQDFYKRYEDQEIPLVEALDPDIGLGYPSNDSSHVASDLVDDLVLPQKERKEVYSMNRFYAMLYKKAISCIENSEKEVVLVDDDIKELSLNWKDLPPTLYAMFEIISDAPNNLSIKLNCFSGSSAARMLARFAHANKNIANLVDSITKKEQELVSDAIVAEIAHLPDTRVGNVLYRPHIRDYEITYLATSDLLERQILKITDLMLSVRSGRLVLRSKKLRKQVLPRLTTAHYYSEGLPVYRFLCDMQTQKQRNALVFSWGSFVSDFRPRVRYHNTILSLATWFVKNDDMKHLFKIKDDILLLMEVDRWRRKIKLPVLVLMPESDNELFVDWRNVISIRALFSVIRHKLVIEFKEFIFDPDKAVIKGSKGAYLNEFIVPFYFDSK